MIKKLLFIISITIFILLPIKAKASNYQFESITMYAQTPPTTHANTHCLLSNTPVSCLQNVYASSTRYAFFGYSTSGSFPIIQDRFYQLTIKVKSELFDLRTSVLNIYLDSSGPSIDYTITQNGNDYNIDMIFKATLSNPTTLAFYFNFSPTVNNNKIYGIYMNYQLRQLSESDVNSGAQLDEQKKTNEKLDDLNEKQQETNDYIKDDTAPDVDIGGLGTVQGLLPEGPVDSLLNIPFMFLTVATSSFGGVCVPLQGTWVFNSTLNIPCFGDLFYDEVPAGLMVFINLIPSAFILIGYFKHLYKKVDRAVSMETNSDDEWGVL